MLSFFGIIEADKIIQNSNYRIVIQTIAPIIANPENISQIFLVVKFER
ncbi:hypothetical protein H1P_1220012 [Hyella patelloides LEGE 07179]|uniref:Uncharacterized protein n=1 Tax=Hyella patelloides LEGE 07179 TaxID=945734 RepID=A0A563VKI2_9CYAN|nr:hypothetical protein H1P_1220012 [Hyella patelloides LEGE 07179]